MFLTSSFIKIVDSINLEIEQKIRQKIPRFTPKYKDIFLDSVDLWLAKLYDSDRHTDKCKYIWDLANSEDIIDITYSIYKAIKSSPPNRDKKILNMNINSDIRTIVIIALGLTGFGLLLFLHSSRDNQSVQETPKQAYPIHCQYLVLVIGANKADILNNLGINDDLDYDLCEKLYQSTKFIWVGSKQQSLSLFGDSFAQRGSLGYGQQSEYDVYFVKIELLNYNEDGFDAEVSSIKRIDAFRKLADVGKIVAISERLSASSYQRKNLYNR